MRAILMSIRPQWVAKILNGEKTIEIRKRFPSDYVGWVYIYCTKDSKKGWCMNGINGNETYYQKYDRNAVYSELHNYIGNGKVVARFWCDNVEQVFWLNPRADEHIPFLKSCDLLKCACLYQDELEEYVGDNKSCAIHITKLEIFDKPKEISEFKTKLHIKGGCKNCPQNTGFSMPYCKTCDFLLPLTRAPQSWCYVEV